MMSNFNWALVIGWPIVVVLINNWLSHIHIKNMAKATADAFNKSGLALKFAFNAIRDIERELEKLGAKVPIPIDSRDR